jgi:uncharacterized protein (UPF0179 family)
MPLVTLIGEKLAVEGNEFIYLGPNNECRNCKLKTVCFNLKPGRHYQITAVREKQHGCTIHEGNVVVVEVQELPLIAAVDETVQEGSKSKIDKKDCKNIGCAYFELCTTAAIQKDKTYTIAKIIETIECPKGDKLQKAELSDAS